MKIERELTTTIIKEIELPEGIYYYRIVDEDAMEENWVKLIVDDKEQEFSFLRFRLDYGDEVYIVKRTNVYEPPFIVTLFIFGEKGYTGEEITEEKFNKELQKVLTQVKL